MTIRISVLSLVCVIASSVSADQRIGFTRQLQGASTSTFSCDCYSIQKDGPGKMIWYPSAACRIDSCYVSRTCKIWAIMPLRHVEQSVTLPIWHCSQKTRSAEREPSTRYQIQYIGASAETNFTFGSSVENVFDIDAGDVFAWFGRDTCSPLTGLLGSRGLSEKKGDSVLCSSGRIGIDSGRIVLMYGLTAFQDGEILFSFSVNGLGDIGFYSFIARDGRIFDTNGRQIEAAPIVHASAPALSVRLSSTDLVSLRIEYDHNVHQSEDVTGDDVLISLTNLKSIIDWLSKSPETRGPWQATGKCSLDQRRIF